ncbi:ATP-binding protein [Thermococcus sp. Bubb.Bath]|uniref:ATP-binding protein n=1 Tax=Thermococcus sp. Bubb.Bath TaxID=1638242 RepID=UPI001439EC1B|nr:ATP-binding protein [Thermococcus sp. Bubb.Bath]NJF24433.1 ATP-binding protein [Thermococcus sp. Bubb.Bath]
MKVEELKNVLTSQREELLDFVSRERLVERDVEKSAKELLSFPNVLAILGVRRSGKSVLSWRLAGKDVLYVNFFDERLIDFKSGDFERLLSAARELWGEPPTIVLDEVQEVGGWQKFVSRMRVNKRVIVTGSSSKLLSGEMATYLTGRHVELTLFPFSFREFLKLRGVELGENWEHSDRKLAEIKRSLGEYLEMGGFPEVGKFGKLYLSQIYRDLVERDVIMRHNVRHQEALRELARYLISNYSSEFTYSKMGSIVGLKDVHTVRDYVSYLEEAYLVFTLMRFSFKPKGQLLAPRKVYPIDTGIARVLSLKAHPERGKLMELAVFLEIKRSLSYSFSPGEVYYWRDDKGEVDFVIRLPNTMLPLQVIFSLEDTREREIGNLVRVSRLLRSKKALMITWEEKGRRAVDGVEIEILPLWEFLMRGLTPFLPST